MKMAVVTFKHVRDCPHYIEGEGGCNESVCDCLDDPMSLPPEHCPLPEA